MRRREFIAGLGLAAVSPMFVHAQQQAMPVIGVVMGATLKLNERFLASVRKGLAEYGYIEGQNFRFEFREANFQNDLLPILFRELVDQKVSVILAVSTVQLESAKAATQSIPIVFEIGTDPVENGFVASLNKPGGNITGIFNLGLTLTGKRLEMLHELLPSVTKFAFLSDPGDLIVGEIQTRSLPAAANSLGVNLLNVNAHSPNEFEAAFETAVRAGAGGIVTGADSLFNRNLGELVALADRYRLPAIHLNDEFVKAGGLISYGVNYDDARRLMGNYAGRILKGEKPVDLPVQQMAKTILTINLKTAAALGITVPTTLLGRADELIE